MIKYPSFSMKPQHTTTPRAHGNLPQAHAATIQAGDAAKNTAIKNTAVKSTSKKLLSATGAKSEKPMLSAGASLFSAVSEIAGGGGFEGQQDQEDKREEQQSQQSRKEQSNKHDGLTKHLDNVNHLYSNKGVIEQLQAMQQKMSASVQTAKNTAAFGLKTIEAAQKAKDVFTGIQKEFKAAGFVAIPAMSGIKLYTR